MLKSASERAVADKAMKSNGRFKSSTILVRGIASLAALGLLAQGTNALAQSSDGESADDGTNNNEIVVTALKKSQRLIDVGATVSVLSSESIAEARIEQVKDIASSTPNVDIRETIPGISPVLTIRGVGLDDFSTTNSPAAGVSLDEVPLSSIALMNSDFFDLERIEVVKGPQGTLYGRNTVAGALNILSAKPKGEFGAALKLGYGNFQTFDAEGHVNIPLTEDLALRVSGKTIQQGKGFWTSNFLANGAPGTRDLGERDVFAGRVQLGYESPDGLEINAKYEIQSVRSEMGQYQFFGTFVPGMPFVPCAPFLAGTLDNTQCADAFGFTNTSNDPYNIDQDNDVPYNLTEHIGSLRVNYDFGDVTLTSVTGYIDFERAYRIDVDATPRESLDFLQRDDVQQFTQEVRLGYESDLVDVLVGGFYSYDRARGNNDDFLNEVPFILFGFPGQEAVTTFDQTTKSAAGFVNGTWHIGDQLDVITGIRYTWERRRYFGGSSYPLCPTMPVNPFCAAFGIGSTFIDQTISDKNVSWKVGLDYRVAPGSLIYASVSKGTKSGGFVTRFTTTNDQLLPYEPESLIAYEIGAKTQAIDGVTLNAAAFYYDFKDVQALVRDGNTAPPIERLANIPGKSRLYGFEIDAVVTPFEGLTLQSGFGYLNTKLATFTRNAATFSDNRFPNAPKFTFNALARFETPVSDNLRWMIQGDVSHQSSAEKDAGNDPFVSQDAYWLFNARTAISTDDDRWEFAIWGKNLTKEIYTVSGSNLGALGVITRTVNAPRTYGASLSFRY